MTSKLDKFIHEEQCRRWAQFLLHVSQFIEETEYTWFEFSKFVSFEFYLAHPDYPWDIEGLSQNKHIKWEYICSTPEKKWNLKNIAACNPSVSLDILLKYLNVYWELYDITSNPNVNIEVIKQNPDIWCPVLRLFYWDAMLKNPNIKKEDLEGRAPLLTRYNINSLFDFDYLERIGFTQAPSCFGKHPRVTWEFIKTHKYVRWDLYYVVENQNLDFNTIISNEFREFFKTTNPVLDTILWETKDPIHSYTYKYDKNELWRHISCNPRLTWNDVLNNPDKNWMYRYMIYKNPFTYQLNLIREELITKKRSIDIIDTWMSKYMFNSEYLGGKKYALKILYDDDDEMINKIRKIRKIGDLEEYYKTCDGDICI